MKRAAIYTRVSSEDQIDGHSLTIQEESLRDFCKKNDYSLLEEHFYKEEGVSGQKTSRKELDRLVEAARKKEFDIVLVYKVDRFSRNLKHLLNLVDELSGLEIGFKSITEPFDTINPSGSMMFHLLGVFADYERQAIRERTLSGQSMYLKDGNWNSSVPPYGYNYDKETHKLVVNEKEAEVVRQMFQWLVDERLSLYMIQKRLNDLKIPTKFTNIGREKKRDDGCFWRKRTVGRILENEVYSGSFTYRKHKYLGRVKGENNLRPKEEWIVISTPPLVSKETWGMAQEQIKKNKQYARRKEKREYLFGKMLWCGECGGKFGSMFCHSTKNGIADRKRYHCFNRSKWISGGICKANSVAENRIADPIWEKVHELLSNPGIVFEQLEKERVESHDDIVKKIENCDTLIASNKGKLERLLSLYVEGNITKDEYTKRSDQIGIEMEKCQLERNKYDTFMLSEQEKSLQIKNFEQVYKKYKRNLDSLSYSQKREVLKMLVEKIVIKKSDVDIHVNVPKKVYEGQLNRHPRHDRRGWA